jgi:acyl carrier protein
MNRTEAIELVVACFEDALSSSQADSHIDERTVIFGRDGVFDSIQLVNLLMEVEQRVNDRCGTAISIVDDRAMSQKASPFRTIGTLSDYVSLLIAEQKSINEKPDA